MNDRQMLDLIKQSAEEVTVPESLMPGQIEKRIAKEKKRKQKIRKYYTAYAVTAAVLLIACVSLVFGSGFGINGLIYSDKGAEKTASLEKEEAVPEMEEEAASVVAEAPAEEASGEEVENSGTTAKKDAGELYRVASDYRQVYEVVNRQEYRYLTDGVFNEPMEDAGASVAVQKESAYEELSEEKETAANEVPAAIKYSTTNLQVQGVDESDIVKTDGSYLYVVTKGQIRILDIRGTGMKETAVMEIPSGRDNASVQEIYVDNGKLLAIVQERETELKEREGKFYTVSGISTVLYTYSLENPASLELLGSFRQDGTYFSSRKIGDKVYLFTRESLAENCDENDVSGDGWIPLAGEEKIPADCIYIPEKGGNGLVISSVDVDNPGEALDQVMIVNDQAEIYVSTKAVYLYHTDRDTEVHTQIAKFSLEKGIIDAVGAASVRGRVTDTFAVSEYQDHFRILTCDEISDRGNSLFILDRELNCTGKLEGIAPGETVYAARYLGSMAYFVTYRNVDPLFAADLSDPADPKILGELKITGYSEYLHMWKEGKMLGIGYETDPDTGNRLGVKLSMFDVSVPSEPKDLDTVCISNADYSPAFDQYKSVLADPSANLLGFVVTSYGRRMQNTYLLFEWKDGEFCNLLTCDMGDGGEFYRGVYVGNVFYTVTSEGVTAYDRQDGYRKIGEMIFF